MFCKAWGENLSWNEDDKPIYHEAHNLSLDITKARETLSWIPKWSLFKAINKVVEWHKAQLTGRDVYDESIKQIKEFLRE